MTAIIDDGGCGPGQPADQVCPPPRSTCRASDPHHPRLPPGRSGGGGLAHNTKRGNGARMLHALRTPSAHSRFACPACGRSCRTRLNAQNSWQRRRGGSRRWTLQGRQQQAWHASCVCSCMHRPWQSGVLTAPHAMPCRQNKAATVLARGRGSREPQHTCGLCHWPFWRSLPFPRRARSSPEAPHAHHP